MNKAFTLLELLVVLLILGITTSAGFITYTRSTAEKILIKDTEDLENILTLAKERAVRRDESLSPGCVEFRGYDVQFTPPSNYKVRMICRVGGFDTFIDVPTHTYSLTNNTFQAAPSQVSFYYPFGCLDATGNCGAPVTRTITIQSLTKRCISVTVNNLGVVSSGDPVSCP